MLGFNRRHWRLGEEGMVESGVVKHQGHPKMEERASASEVCSSEGQEGELLHKNRGPTGELEEEALQ